jgi:hypothetical protein
MSDASLLADGLSSDALWDATEALPSVAIADFKAFEEAEFEEIALPSRCCFTPEPSCSEAPKAGETLKQHPQSAPAHKSAPTQPKSNRTAATVVRLPTTVIT